MSGLKESDASNSVAQTLAGNAILLEVGARLGLLDPILSRAEISVPEVARTSGIEESLVFEYYSALTHAGLAGQCPNQPDGRRFSKSRDLQKSINEAGYILWGVMSCAPLISNARAFNDDFGSSVRAYVRDGEHVARTSRWMGEVDFYPQAEAAILSSGPKKVVDLGSGTCGLLIRCLRKLPGAVGVGIDINAAACARARSIIEEAGMTDRLSVINASIQSLVQDPSPLEGAEAIHAGFVFHDLMPDEEPTLDSLLKTFRMKATKAMLVVVDAVPYASHADERSFSAAFTFLHSHFMGRRLMTEEEWKTKFNAAGYKSVKISHLGISGGRIFRAASA